MYKSGFISCQTDTFGRMDNSSQLKIRWNNFPLTVSSSLEALRNNGDLVDTSLFCEGRRFLVSDIVCFSVEMQWICLVTSFLFIIKAHRVVLSATSNYFRQIFKEIASPNVAIVLSGLNHQDIDALLTFIYSGEVSLCEPQLASFLKTAETLQVCQFDCHHLSIISKMVILVNYIHIKIKGLGPDYTSSFSRNTEIERNETLQETQFLAAALQKPLASRRATPPPLLSVYTTPPSVTPVSTTASLPSIDLSVAISNFTSSASSSNSSSQSDVGLRKRKLAELPDGCMKMEMPEERKAENLILVDMTPPNSIANDDLNEPHPPRQDPLQERAPAPPRTDPTPRPYQSQCRGNSIMIWSFF